MWFLLLALSAFVLIFLPQEPVDPWGLFPPQKWGILFLAFSILQVAGASLSHWLGGTWGAIFVGFWGGFVSSTAVTVRAARATKRGREPTRTAVAEVLAACLGMLVEAFVLLSLSSWALAKQNLPTLLGFFLPGLLMLLIWFRHQKGPVEVLKITPEVDLLHSLQLTLIVAGLLFLIGFGRQQMGESGVQVLSFVTSLFEMHAVLVANSQLFQSGHLTPQSFHSLIFWGLFAAHLSKLGLALMIGSRAFFEGVGVCLGVMVLGGGLVSFLTGLNSIFG